VSIWNVLAQEQRVLNKGVKHKKEGARSSVTAIVNPFKEVESILAATRVEREVQKLGYGYESINLK
jgi:hypothetical protein